MSDGRGQCRISCLHPTTLGQHGRLRLLFSAGFLSFYQSAGVAPKKDMSQILGFTLLGLKVKLYEAIHKNSLVSGLHQVISRALSVWGLDLVPRDSSDPAAVRAKSSPIAANAYICNYRCPLPILFFSPNLMKSIAGSTGLPSGDLEISGSISTHSWRALSW